MMDSNVLRLIRRYDPANVNSTGSIPRRTLETTRGIWNTIATNPSESSPILSQRSLTTAQYDDLPLTPRLQRQQAIQENEPPIPPPPPVNYIRPILKYNSTRSRSEFIVQPHQTEPLSVEIDPYIMPITNESSASYQPLITTANKRVCSALSKSEWDLRLQQEQVPARPPSPPLTLINQQSIKDALRQNLNRSKSSGVINEIYDQDEQFDNVSNPPTSSCVEKIKQLFVSKSSQDTNDSADGRSQKSIDKSPSISSQTRSINKPTTIVQDVTPNWNKKSNIHSEKLTDSPVESVNRSNYMNIPMAVTEISPDAYRFRRLNEQDPSGIRSKNIAKVEPYQMNTSTNAIRPLYQSSSNSQTTATGVIPSSKACINLNSMGNTPVNSSSSSAGSLGNGLIRNSDFILPNPVVQYPKTQPIPPNFYPNQPSIFAMDSRPHGSLPSSSKNHFQDPYQTIPHNDFHSSTQIPANYNQYQPAQINNSRQQSEMPMYPTVVEQQDNQQSQSRRRFQRRKQMKRSKSVDLYQDPSTAINHLPDLTRNPRAQRSISREYLINEENILSSSSSSASSLDVEMERTNRAAILRYKSLDSIAYNNRKSAVNAKTMPTNRKLFFKPTEFDFDSDDSVCGIPKPRKTNGR